VRRATGEYRAELDILAAFLKDCCEVEADGWTYARDLYRAYRWWCEETGERPEPQKRFGGRLKDRGYESRRGGSRGAALYDGLLLTDGARSAAEGALTQQKVPVSRSSEGTDPKHHINTGDSTPRGVMRRKGSEGSEGSAVLGLEDVLRELRKPDSGPALALGHYLEIPSALRLEYLTKAVLVSKKIDTAEWDRYRDVVEEAAAELEGGDA
jgi:hypothetical protein